MNEVQRNICELVALLVQNAKPHKQTLHKSTNTVRNAIEDAEKIIRSARIIDRWLIAACNGIERYDAKAGQRIAQWTEADAAAHDKALEKEGTKIEAILHDYKTARPASGSRKGLHIQRDPRGSTVRLYFKTGYWFSLAR